MISFLNSRLLFDRYKFVRPIAIVAIIVLGFSISHKIFFFFGEDSVGPSFIERSTFYVSFMQEQYLRLFVYISLFLGGAGILFVLAYYRRGGSLLYFYLPVLFTIPFEGLGLVSFLIVIIWFYLGVRPAYSREKRYGGYVISGV
jgi:hypothetical protein